MPYSSVNGNLPNESASKLGHLNVIKSSWVKSLIEDFEYVETSTEIDTRRTNWKEFDSNSDPLMNIWAVDGSFVKVTAGNHPPKEVAFIKTALLMVDKVKIELIDPKCPHPLQIRDIMDNSALFHSTVFPLNNIRTSKGNNYDAVRHIIFDSLQIDENGAYYETLKWITYKKWDTLKDISPNFQCPSCAKVIDGFPYDSDTMKCPYCHNDVLLTDMLGFHLDMIEDSAPESVASAYMLIVETLMLFTPIRLLWDYSDHALISNTLFIKDGPLSLASQYSKLVPNIRIFMQFAKDKGRPVHIIGCEKSGKFFDHLISIENNVPPHSRNEKMHYFVLPHQYILDEVQRRPLSENQYGSRTNWGEKIYVKAEPGTFMVLNIPTGFYNSANDFPKDADIIGLNRILQTIPSLISRKHEGALFPIELANGIASMSSYPSAKILERYMDSNIKSK
ncbi:hypothetical protein [Geosporobacter ferrireducens]|uniref:NurA domain-containing protein n=1 Tax=Geosporobacter ferrireducens TaxID=1424294 RepID=A0A1D8GBN2_9FIRM|nr:hypothetical protein [Geosporobacter ferrireducens]AOT68327.1 hypothetical protein Gferi_01205 [Geosporobacter ferrireducens]